MTISEIRNSTKFMAPIFGFLSQFEEEIYVEDLDFRCPVRPVASQT